jgi:hypothetical protein
MNASSLRRSAVIVVTALVASLTSGCLVGGGGYGYDGPDYYEASGGAYGGWGPGYYVGPVRGGYGGGGRGERPPTHGYRPAPSSRPMPSIPSQPRGGGSRPR